MQCEVPAVSLCILCFTGKFETLRHKHDHEYLVLSGDKLNVACMNSNSIGNILLLLDSSRKFSVGSWDEVSTRARISPVRECEKSLMDIYKSWSRICNDNFPMQEYFLKAKALDKFIDNGTGGMYIETVHPPKVPSDMHGFMANRVDFEIEYDDSAELIIADIELNDDDTHDDRRIKLECLKAYSERTMRREGVKSFVVSRGLTGVQHQLDNHRTRTAEEVELRGKLRPVERLFTSAEDFEFFIQLTLYERRLENRLTKLQTGLEGGTKTPSSQPAEPSIDVVSQVDMDHGEDKPITRSKAGVEANKKTKSTEAECIRISEILTTEAIKTGISSAISPEEKELIHQLQIQPDMFSILRDTLLTKLNLEGCHTADVSISQLGESLKVDVVGSCGKRESMKLE